ncbi:MAG: hypothetical protein JWL77_1075 [Chthonomonadaceae bacterium]|nr:hypothetical protein [Chthonomonadaceae bacterium]
MIRRHSQFVGLSLITATSALSLIARGDPPTGAVVPSPALTSAPAKKIPIVHDFSHLPLSFEPNRGQTDASVRFLHHSGAGALFLTPSEAVFCMTGQSHVRQTDVLRTGRKNHTLPTKVSNVVLRMQMVGADPKAMPLMQQPLPGRINYFIGKDPSKWHAGVPTFGRVGFHGVYPGVDLVYYGNQKHLEYDFVVAPHADPRQIKLHFAGAQGVHVDVAGDLIVHTKSRELRWAKPMVYQQDATGKHAVAAGFRLKRLPNGQADVSFALGRYNTDRPLVIDPVLLYSTYLGGTGGSGSTAEIPSGIAIDNSGNAYVTGSTYSTDFPTTVGAFQTTKNLGTNVTTAFVTKFNSTGTALVYSTYLGGTDSFGSSATGIAIDSSGNAFVAGSSSSTDFPTTTGALQRVRSGSNDAFVTKLNSTGTALVYSTLLGGSASDRAAGVAIDSSGNAYLAGSSSSSDFPITPGAFQQVEKGGTNSTSAFVAKLNSTGTGLLYSTFLGGSVQDVALGIAIDNSGNAYVAGSTFSTDFPTTPGAFQPGNNSTVASVNGFVTKLNATGTALIYSTYLGGSYGDNPSGIAIDTSGNAYVVGSAFSTDFPTTSGAFQRVKKGVVHSPNAFVTKLNPTGTALLYSTYLGGSGGTSTNGDGANSIAVDSAGNAFIAGYSHSPDFPTTLGAFQRGNHGGAGAANAFLTRLNSTGTALLYGTYLGGSFSGDGGESATGVAIDSNNSNVYLTGNTKSTDFPLTPGAFQQVKKSPLGVDSAFVTKLSSIPIFPDFNNDGNTDLLIQNASTNAIASWFMQGSQWNGGAFFSLTPPSDYALVGVGDFSGNGANTLLLQSRTTNQVALWYTSGANNATIPGGHFLDLTPASGWKVVGIGDFNGDGKSDLVFQNQTTNQIAIWFMNNYVYLGGVLMPFTPPTGWTVAGVGDFNADGFPDIAFQNQTTGQIVLWYMNNSTYVGGTLLTTVPASGWKVVGVGDYNGDGSADLLFQNQTSNQAAVWYLTNGAFAGGDVLSLAPPSGWKIVGPR